MFWGLEFETPDYVLSPYRETEALIEKILTILCPYVDYRIADLGTGSGCIAVAIAKERPDCTIIATDINQDIVDVAQANAIRNGVDIEFRTGSWCEPLDGDFHMIIANVPFLDKGIEGLPDLAIISGKDGMDATREVCRDSFSMLCRNGWLFIGNSSFKSEQAKAIMTDSGFMNVKSLEDTSGDLRFTMGRKCVSC